MCASMHLYMFIIKAYIITEEDQKEDKEATPTPQVEGEESA